MKSQQEIYDQLSAIAVNNNLYGDSIEVQKLWLSHLFYNYGIDVMNAFRESNLATAALMNSRILHCMNEMYSVYRGKCASLIVRNFTTSESIDSFRKYDLLFRSNNLYVYFDKKLSTGVGEPDQFKCILTKKQKYVSETQLNEQSKYYVDVKINNITLSNLSEEIRVTINGQEYKTTRLFFDHINEDIYKRSEQIRDDLIENTIHAGDNLFILTIPDYGIRIFKKGYFNPSDKVVVECFDYTTKEELRKFESEISRIRFAGFLMEIDFNKNDYTNNSYVEKEVPRDDLKSLLNSPTAFNHVQSMILSNSDVNQIFTEVNRGAGILDCYHKIFKGEHNAAGHTLHLYYASLQNGDQVISEEDFSKSYGSYFVTDDIELHEAQASEVKYDIDVVVTKPIDNLVDQIVSIINKYCLRINKVKLIDSDGSIHKSTMTEEAKKRIPNLLNHTGVVQSNLININDTESWQTPGDLGIASTSKVVGIKDDYSVRTSLGVYHDSKDRFGKIYEVEDYLNDELIRAEITKIDGISYIKDFKRIAGSPYYESGAMVLPTYYTCDNSGIRITYLN